MRSLCLILITLCLCLSGNLHGKPQPEYPPGGAAYETWLTTPRSTNVPYGNSWNGGAFFPLPLKFLKDSVHGTKMLQEFYFKLLLSKFDEDKLARKYDKILSPEIRNDLDTLTHGQFSDQTYLGWQVFLGKGMQHGSYCDVKFLGDDWYAATLPDIEGSAVFVKLERVGKKGHLTVTQVKNPFLGIELSASESEK